MHMWDLVISSYFNGNVFALRLAELIRLPFNIVFQV